MSISLSTHLATDFERAVKATREALARQGFSVLTEIDITTTLKIKLGIEMENYLILGACDPELACRAIDIDREIGLLLPCNVLVRADVANPGMTIVDAMDPCLSVVVTGEPALKTIADEITAKLAAAIASLDADS
ncbi:DUF302 domain-containing protein [Mycobacterium sherrisii]|uniref:ABC transporter n=1 Tax=Mycobacterium sherrisii TaxID=243061 RepID=A0A1E3SN03_9MYCO|nr:DUF302 domain-containing protein [Mycobacterium sherrisii]MCV7031077.1 DUF302 domain-containing protein [Mycobacterium sherrisii]ODR03545.1 ABC transporter [Mycobacterium sherrisii]ORW72039.1 ABC transporter [Mycobacterium sherrisii]